jgi:hypothetical protein
VKIREIFLSPKMNPVVTAVYKKQFDTGAAKLVARQTAEMIASKAFASIKDKFNLL